MSFVTALAVVACIAAAVRSTWSPCGLSMLSSITPLAERGKGQRFAVTSAWFVLGAVLGGVTLGAATAALAAVRSLLAVPAAVVIGVAVTAALACALSDAGVRTLRLPRHTRQVDQQWLRRYRGWVYGVGFGWQIGVGVSTYIVTAAVYLMVVLGVVGASPAACLALGAAFGAIRGLAVLLGAGATSPETLYELHRRFEAAREPVRVATILTQVALAVAAAVAFAREAPAALALVGAALVVLAVPVALRHLTAGSARVDDRNPRARQVLAS